MRTQIPGELPIAIHLVVEQQHLKLKKVVMTQLSAIESIHAQAKLLEGQYITIGELASMTKLQDDHGNEYPLTYDLLGHSSRKNFDYLKELRDQLDAKEIAENSETEQNSSES